jgi:hypothetical protein
MFFVAPRFQQPMRRFSTARVCISRRHGARGLRFPHQREKGTCALDMGDRTRDGDRVPEDDFLRAFTKRLVQSQIEGQRHHEILYHYTSAAGLLGIVTSGMLRGFNYLYMNDLLEIEYGKQVALEFLGSEVANRKAEEKTVVERVLRYLTFGPSDPDYSDPIIRRAQTLEVYFASFCEAPDLLSQWRGYGGPTGRYCIGIDTREVTGIDLPFPVRVIYNRQEQVEFLRTTMEAFFSTAKEVYGSAGVDQAMRSQDFLLTDSIARTLCRFKHHGFAEEREWRSIVNVADYDDVKLVDFDVAGNTLRPFVTILRGSRSDPQRLPIREIYVGHSRRPTQARHAVEQLLRKSGYRNCEVLLSDVPFDE